MTVNAGGRLWGTLLRIQLKLPGAGGKNCCRNCDRADESISHSLDSPKPDESLRSISKLRPRSNCYVGVLRFAIMRVSEGGTYENRAGIIAGRIDADGAGWRHPGSPRRGRKGCR